MSFPLLTIGITAHDEKSIAHKTMQSVFLATRELEKKHIEYEIIVHIDKGDKETKKYFSRYANRTGITIYKNTFGDLGESRNFIVDKARGKYVSFLDADDLISPNWYLNSIQRINEEKNDVIVHPESELHFSSGQTNHLILRRDSGKRDEEAFYLFDYNQWCSVVTAKKEVFKNNRYKKNEIGYDGYEDYDFNLQTTWKNIRHVIAKNTILFYRQKGEQQSMRLLKKARGCVQPYSELFNIDYYKRIKPPVCINDVHEKMRIRYKRIRDNHVVKILSWPIVKTKQVLIKQERSSNPDDNSVKNKTAEISPAIIENWRIIGKIEHQLNLCERDLASLLVSGKELTPEFKLGLKYKKLVSNVSKVPDYIFIAPSMVTRGKAGDLLNYIEAIRDSKGLAHICIISTDESSNKWKGKIPRWADYVDFGDVASDCDKREKDLLFSRLIVQLKCKKIHIIKPGYGETWASKHKDLINNNYVLYEGDNHVGRGKKTL